MEQVLDSCCGFLHDTNKETEPQMIERFMTINEKYGKDYEVGGYKRRAFLITRKMLEGSVPLVDGWYGLTWTPWDREKVEKMPESAHHVKPYTMFYSKKILGGTVHNIAGFDGPMEPRQEKFDQHMLEHPTLPKLCILSNSQHNLGEPFLLKNGFTPQLRGRNNYWHENHLTIFTHPAQEAQAAA